jgi:hypothetical protein
LYNVQDYHSMSVQSREKGSTWAEMICIVQKVFSTCTEVLWMQ